MAVIKEKNSLKNLRHRYRLTILNEDSFEEVAAFSMTRGTVTSVISFLFVVLIGLTIILIAFSPLKYYIPGYGSSGDKTEYATLKQKADSLESVLQLQQQYMDGIRSILKGTAQPLDTSLDKSDNAY